MKILKKTLYIIVCKLLYRVEFRNEKNKKSIDKCVVFSNHVDFFDPIMLYSDIEDLAVMAKKELFENKLLGKILLKSGVFPVNREKIDITSLKNALNVFKKSKYNKLLIYPEGTRVKDNARVDGKLGALYIAMKSGVPILPVSIDMKKKSLFSKVYITYHEPMILEYNRIKDKEYMQKLTDNTLDMIYNHIKG